MKSVKPEATTGSGGAARNGSGGYIPHPPTLQPDDNPNATRFESFANSDSLLARALRKVVLIGTTLSMKAIAALNDVKVCETQTASKSLKCWAVAVAVAVAISRTPDRVLWFGRCVAGFGA